MGMRVTCADGTVFGPEKHNLVGSVKRVRDRDHSKVRKPGVVGEFPVLVEQSGDYKMFTYSSKISDLEAV